MWCIRTVQFLQDGMKQVPVHVLNAQLSDLDKVCYLVNCTFSCALTPAVWVQTRIVGIACGKSCKVQIES